MSDPKCICRASYSGTYESICIHPNTISSPASGNFLVFVLQSISLCCGQKDGAEPIYPSLSVGCGVWSVGKLKSMPVGTAAASAANKQARGIFGIQLYFVVSCTTMQ